MLLACCYKNSFLKINNINVNYMENVLNVINSLGVKIDINKDSVIIETKTELNKIDIIIETYPSFPTDLQQILTIVLLNCGGKIKDLIFPNRIAHVEQLRKINADIEVVDNEIIINKSNLLNNELNGIDLRGTFGLIVASGMLQGNTKVVNIDNVFRGYENLEHKLKNINFPIQLIQ
jgi:UDP-N-acetylglucosamine 1-carboxyvinyltransferase